MIEIRETLVGKGVFAKLRIPSNTYIGKVTGEIITDADHSSDYCMDLGNDCSLEPHAPFRFMNHSCEPNCELMCDPDTQEIWVEAIRTIRVGDQLCIDYSWDARSAIPCKCGAKKCRGWIVDPDEMDELKNHLKAQLKAQKKVEKEAKQESIENFLSTPSGQKDSKDIKRSLKDLKLVLKGSSWGKLKKDRQKQK